MSLIIGALANSYDVDVLTHLQRLSATPSYTVTNALNTLVKGLKTDGLWTILDDLCVYHANGTDAVLGLKGTQDSVSSGSPSYTSDGFTINQESGSYAYLNTQMNRDGVLNYTTDDCTIFMYGKNYTSSPAGGAYSFGQNTNLGVANIEFASGINNFIAGNATINSINADTDGFRCISRTTSTRADSLDSGTAGFSTDSNSTPAPTVDIYIGVTNNAGSPAGASSGARTFSCSAWGVGGGMTSSQQANLRSRIETYLTSVGSI